MSRFRINRSGSRERELVLVSEGSWEEEVPDEAFRTALEAEGITSLTLLRAATTIDLTAHTAELAGADWEGIEHATAVTTLNITGCGMVGLLSLIGACTTLTELRGYGNNPTSGVCNDLSTLTALTYLNFGNGSIGGDIADLAPLTALQTLNLRLTSVTGNISVYSNFPDLTDTHMSDLSGLVGDLGVFSALPDLEEVFLYNTSVDTVTSPSFTTQANLSKLWLHNTSLVEAGVDAVLADCVTSLDVAGRVTCELRLTDTEPPSAAGEADQDTLEAAGWTVQVDITGEATPTLTYEIQDPAPSLTTEQQLWWDRVFNAFDTETLNDYPAVTGDDTRRHNNIRDPLVHAATALLATNNKAALEWVDSIGEALWDTLDYGYRGTPTGSVWNDGDHILDGDGVIDSSKLLIFVVRVEQASDFSSDTEGTDLSYSMAESRWMQFTCLLMEIYRQNFNVSLPASAERTRTSKETTAAPDGTAGLASGTETFYGDRYDRWKWWNTHHMLPKWNRLIKLYETFGGSQALDDPWGVDYMQGATKTSYQADGGDAMSINYYLWKATGTQKYEDAAKTLTDYYMDVWNSTDTTDEGRTGLLMPRLFMRDGEYTTYSTSNENCWTLHHRPTDYIREDTARLGLMQVTGWYRFADDSFLRRVHHNMADNIMYNGVPTSTSYKWGTDTGGHQTRRFGWVRPTDSTEVWLESCQDGFDENICQSFNETGPSRIDSSPYLIVLPWADSQTRLRSIAQGVYDVEHGSSMTPDRVGAAAALLLDAVVNNL